MRVVINQTELIEGCRQGDQKAMAKLYQTHADKMYGVCVRYTKDTEVAADVMQDGFIKVFKGLEKFKGDGSLEGWIRRIMVNTALDYYRKNSKMHLASDYDLQMPDEDAANALDQMEGDEVMSLIQRLPEGYRVVLNMFIIEGYSHQEISDKLGISPGTSKSQLSRAREQLKTMILKEREKGNYNSHGREQIR